MNKLLFSLFALVLLFTACGGAPKADKATDSSDNVVQSDSIKPKKALADVGEVFDQYMKYLEKYEEVNSKISSGKLSLLSDEAVGFYEEFGVFQTDNKEAIDSFTKEQNEAIVNFSVEWGARSRGEK